MLSAIEFLRGIRSALSIKVSAMSGFRTTPAPLLMVWEATHECNLECQDCYVRTTNERETRLLDTRSVTTIIWEAARLGLFCLVISGGEPLLRGDVFEIRRFASDLGLFVSLTTNGLLIDEARIREISMFDHISVSIDDAHEKAWAGSHRGSGGPPDDLLERLLRLARTAPGLIVNVQVVVDSSNWQRLLDYNLKFYHLGLDAVFQLRRGSRFAIDTALWCDMISKMKFRSRGIGWMQKRFLRLFPRIAEGGTAAPCLALTSGFAVSPGGHLLPCSFRRETIADISRDSLASVWNSIGPLRRFYASKSRGCACANTCFVMPATILAWHPGSR